MSLIKRIIPLGASISSEIFVMTYALETKAETQKKNQTDVGRK